MQSRKRRENSAVKYLRLTDDASPRKWPSAKSKEPFSSATNVKLRSNCEHAACLECRQNYENSLSDPSLRFITNRWFFVLRYNPPHLPYVKRVMRKKISRFADSRHLIIFFAIHRALSNYVRKISKMWRNCIQVCVGEFTRVFFLSFINLLVLFSVMFKIYIKAIVFTIKLSLNTKCDCLNFLSC